LPAQDQPKPGGEEKEKPPAGRAEVLRQIPKKFATFQAVDLARRQVKLIHEGETDPRIWPVNPDAEIKIHGWWGRLDQLQAGDRVWVWFDVDRKMQPRSILMLADELSQQDIHGFLPTLEAVDLQAQTVTLKPFKGNTRTLKLAESLRLETESGQLLRLIRIGKHGGVHWLEHLKLGDKFFVQTAGDRIRHFLDAAGMENLRNEQRMALRQRWIDEGLPSTVVFLHPLSGEMDLMLDHEAIRWGRFLKTGDKVTLRIAEPIDAVVKEVHPWRERTQLRLVVTGFAQADLSLGQRVRMHMPAAPQEVEQAELPPDLDRPRQKAERIEWFLASTYCSCKVANDTCTGMFYTLASCNTNGCGMPNFVRDRVAKLIDKGLNDQQIFAELKKTQGPLMLKQHLLP
jgi:hypothetical protein